MKKASQAGGVVWMEHWLWEGRDVGHEALGQQRQVKAEPHQDGPDWGLPPGAPLPSWVMPGEPFSQGLRFITCEIEHLSIALRCQ